MAKSSKRTTLMAPTSYTVAITLTDQTDPNGPNNFNYAPGFLQVHRGDNVKFKCNRPFTVTFLYGTPFGNVSEFFSTIMDRASDVGTIDPNAAFQAYHYTVSATDPDGKIHVDGSCPTLVVG